GTVPPVAPPRPFTPADIADRPALPPNPQPLGIPAPSAVPAPPAGGGAYPLNDGFTLPQGSWGDHFQD
ncbi:MAG TPA: hypothetical protein VK196_11805, partial [Magnetospirillum sp.]|nr:hypothetical protein [Magnetospirillum sp.]